ncbi:uncharacterized protein LOC109799168 isoform X3 [Cajanus cajan]|uniref:uncharacterized protein LOC109799168 isoform X3 n=1 Tax=Cajanus cajan TaxID=3821 RepID=UPI0010FAFAC9|nr:uncharacterized protein LOC109799168 isoform X3 [Cajanus cajan]
MCYLVLICFSQELMFLPPPPPWLEQLLSTTFFTICESHIDAPRNECNMYCLDCTDQAFCFYCKQSSHKDHQVIQIRRSSYHDVVRVTEIQKILDISGVQTRNLLDPFRFCSLGCKLVGIKKNGNARFVLSAKKDEEIGRMHEGIARLASKEELREGIHKQVYQSTPSHVSLQVCSNSRRRKGVPHRAPYL